MTTEELNTYKVEVFIRAHNESDAIERIEDLDKDDELDSHGEVTLMPEHPEDDDPEDKPKTKQQEVDSGIEKMADWIRKDLGRPKTNWLVDELEILYNKWLMEECADELHTKDQLIEAAENLFRYDEFKAEVIKCLED